ncbi:MAG: hypothetical protein HRT68_06950 [Flavobacteriaceae bacterium]|nr:hypothetical protein [Flavobacteriaceae bacterium]
MYKIFLVLTLTFLSCKAQEKKSSKNELQTVSCLIVEKPFVNKAGKVTKHKDLYLRCSIQDYFIKVCESFLSRKELQNYLDKGVSAQIEFRTGEWDHCNEPGQVQSRVGDYVIIKSLE